MKLTIFNGSPRGQNSNTKILLDHFINGFMMKNGNSYNLTYIKSEVDNDKFIKLFKEAWHNFLIDDSNSDKFVKLFKESEQVLLAFPLCHDSMPAIVKAFIESLEPLCGRQDNPGIGFIVQSGFPETIHSRYVEQFLKKLAIRLGCKYTGTVIKGGVEGIKVKPAWMTKKLFKSFHQLGETFGEKGIFDKQIILKLAKPERYSKFSLVIFRILQKIGLTNFYWDSMLKKNNAFEKRFDKPYAR